MRAPLAIVILFLVVAGGCEPMRKAADSEDRRGQQEGPAFEFLSGQPGRDDGHGQWNVRIRGNAMWLAYSKPGRTRDFGTFKLSDSQEKQVWKLIEQARVDRLEGAVADDKTKVMFFFGLVIEERVYAVNLERNEAARDPALRDLVKYLRRLIREYTGKPAEL